MRAPIHTSAQRLQRGFVSIIALLFLSSVVVFVLSKSLGMSGSKSLETQQYLDSIAALALAESGREVTTARIISAVNNAYDSNGNLPANFSLCTASPLAITDLGALGKFEFVSASGTANCTIQIKGTRGTANRTIDVTFANGTSIGVGGRGTDVKLTINNYFDVPAIVAYNLGWLSKDLIINGSNASALSTTTCISPICQIGWNFSTTGTNGFGSLATVIKSDKYSQTKVSQSLDGTRSFSEVGLIMGSTTNAYPVVVDFYASNTNTQNTSNIIKTGQTPTSPWCDQADTLVFGVTSGSLDKTANFLSLEYSSQKFALAKKAHFPTSLDPFFNIFTEIWSINNSRVAPFKVTSISADPKTFTVDNANGIQKDTYLRVTDTNSLFDDQTQVSAVNGNIITVNKVPKKLVINSTICSGVCALFSTPTQKANGQINNMPNNNDFRLIPDSAAVSDVTPKWTGGFLCVSGVGKIKPLFGNSAPKQQWREVISGN